MVSTDYLRVVLKQSKVYQKEVSKEWSVIVGKEKAQPRVSAELEKTHTDSVTFLKAVSNLTRIPMMDLLSEVTESRSMNAIIYTAPDGDNEVIPIRNSVKSAAQSLLNIRPEDKEDGPEFDFISVPKQFTKTGGVKMLARISGESMSPTLNPDDYIACRLLEEYDWTSISDDKIYLIETNNDDHFLKRVKNRIHEIGIVFCTSDNPNKQDFPDYSLKFSDISQVWEVTFKLSWGLSNPGSSIEDKFKGQDSKLIDHDAKINMLLNEMKKLKNENS